jgi:hypothetical protein
MKRRRYPIWYELKSWYDLDSSPLESVFNIGGEEATKMVAMTG